MATDATSTIFQSLSKVEKQLNEVLASLDNIKGEALAGGGIITKKMPVNINSAMQKIQAVLDGQGPDSINSLIDFIINVPMSGYSKEAAARNARGGQVNYLDDEAPAAPAEVNTTPDTSNGPQSALAESTKYGEDIAQDSLKQFYRENYGRQKRVRENADPFSWDAILDSDAMSDELDYDIGSVGDQNDYIGDTPFNPTEYVPDLEKANDEYLNNDDYEFSEDDSEDETIALSDWANVGDKPMDLGSLSGELSDGLNIVDK